MKKTLREQVYDAILRSILNGEYDVETVITEKAMIERFGCSKSPVRDALVSLCSDGILESIPRFGYRPVRYEKSFYDGIQRFRQIIEPKYLEERWEYILPADIERLRKIEEAADEDPQHDSPVQYWKHNRRFHLGIAEALKDQFYLQILRHAMDRQRLVFVQHYWNRWDPTIFEDYTNLHVDIVDAMESGDRDTAVAKLAEDISTFIRF